MPKEIKFALYAIKKNIQSSTELRASFLMTVIGMAINNIGFILIWVFFVQSVGVIGGWTAADVIGLNGFAALCYGLVFSAGMGLRKLPETVSFGAFDRYLTSPKNLFVRITTSAFSAPAVGDILFGTVCLTVYGLLIHASIYQILMIIGFVVFSSIVFLAIAVMVYSTSFFFMDSGVITNGIFEIFFTPSLFHGGAFQGTMRFIFTFIVPSLLIGAIPVEAVKSLSVANLGLVAVLAVGWFLLSLLVFNKAVRKYESSNFMTFGN